jgi:hypothetical protein
MTEMMQTDLKTTTESQSVARATVTPIGYSRRLFSIQLAVDPEHVKELNQLDWLSRPYEMDYHSRESNTFQRRILTESLNIQEIVDQEINNLLPAINLASGQNFKTVGATWQICESGFVCPMHTDGHKPNVMIIYWQTPGIEWGTKFYHTNDSTDVWYEFPAVPGTGFFANYEPEPGEPWPEMWHASLRAVPENTYRLLTQYEFHK